MHTRQTEVILELPRKNSFFLGKTPPVLLKILRISISRNQILKLREVCVKNWCKTVE